MSTLIGRSPKNSLTELLKVQAPSLGSTLSTVETGDGTATPLQLSSTTISLNGVSWPTAGIAAGKVLTVGVGGTSLSWETPTTGATWSTITGKPAVIAAGADAAAARMAIGMDQVSNTSDSAKPVSTATQTALNAKLTITAAPYDIATTIAGKPGVNEVIMRIVAPRAFNVSSAVGKVATVGTTASTIFTVAKNGTSIGTITFAVGSATPTVSITSTNFAVNDVLTVTAPATQNAALADLDVTVAATLV